MSLNTDGEWLKLYTEGDFAEAQKATVHRGTWHGPGWYYKTRYSQRCPRG